MKQDLFPWKQNQSQNSGSAKFGEQAKSVVGNVCRLPSLPPPDDILDIEQIIVDTGNNLQQLRIGNENDEDVHDDYANETFIKVFKFHINKFIHILLSANEINNYIYDFKRVQ